jgi:hypothetical protein
MENTFKSTENTFQSTENTFRSTKNTFESKKNLVLFPGKCFPFGCVCFPESGFRKTTFQTFLYLFAIRKVGQRKTLSSQRKIWLGFQESVFLKNLGQRKTLSSQRKIWFCFQESVFPLAVFVFRKVVSGKPLSKLSCICLPLEKLVNGKHFPVKGKFGLVFRKVFS